MVTHPKGLHSQDSSIPAAKSAQPNSDAAAATIKKGSQTTANDAEIDIISSQPKLVYDPAQHPINQLVNHAQQEFTSLLSRQSTTLKEAVTEYKRRYGLPPPPLFDKWYDFATKRSIQLIDEYDTIYHSLLPFWALEPSTNRQRVREAIGREANGILSILIRNGKVATVTGGPQWQRDTTVKMISSFVLYLPDMDLAFNIHDEPRVVVPHDTLSHMVRVAKTTTHPRALSNNYLRNSFTRRPKDLNDGTKLPAEVYTLRFNEFAHQPVWTHATLSCAPDSASRDYRGNAPDNTAAYSFAELGFIYNTTAMLDVCNTPSLRTSHGFFDRPNAFKVSHELVPIFSQSKVSSFSDILYPSPWYYYGKTVTDQPPETHKPQYDSSLDIPWSEKKSAFWWRGTTTGGFSRNGGWRHQHRQQFVARVHGLDPNTPKAKIMANKSWGNTPSWSARDISWASHEDFLNVTFTGVGQCDGPDCEAQLSFFPMAPPVNSQEAWGFRHLLDIDGNAFSGRFYAFLRSQSQVFKLAVFKEWHEEWLRPWVHYVPLSLRGEEWLEAPRWFAQEEVGRRQAVEMAEGSREWAGKVLRDVDLEVWMFRLLLEYGRVLDDERESVGFVV